MRSVGESGFRIAVPNWCHPRGTVPVSCHLAAVEGEAWVGGLEGARVAPRVRRPDSDWTVDRADSGNGRTEVPTAA